MKTFLSLCAGAAFCILASCSEGPTKQMPYNQGINVIPTPVSLVQNEGSFKLSKNTAFSASTPEAKTVAEYFAAQMNLATGYQITVSDKAASNGIALAIDEALDVNDEGYTLDVTPQGVTVKAKTPQGLFYGMQTFMQLLPAEIQSPAVVNGIAWTASCVTVKDEPRFEYRGIMLDPCRHFIPVENVKKHLDVLALFKINRMHWHLTDDQAWRIEMKSHPELTHKGSDREGEILGLYPGTYVKRPYGGYYTQEQAREIVEYAAERYITVIPEIDIPGHCMAVLAVHPEFGTEPDKEHKTAQTWGIYNKFNNVLAPKPEVFAFLEDVFSELCDIFPSQYIHVGGDECAKKWWKESAQAQQFMKDNNLKDEDELQSYFIHYVGDVINKKGKTVVGWNEILEGGLAPDAIVMSWQGTSGGITAAKSGHRVIMTPSGYSYYNNMQSRNQTQVTHQGYLPVDKVYGYQVIPDELTKDQVGNIIGVQACLWTEYFPTTAKVEWALFPRLSALAENAWSQPDVKGWDKFLRKMPSQFERYDLWGVRYSDDFFRMYDIKKNDPTTR